MEERLDLIDRLQRKYGDSVEEILAYGQQAQEELAALENAGVRAEGLEAECNRLEQEWLSLAELSHGRRALAQQLEQQIQVELADLAMGDTRFQVQFVAEEEQPALGGRERVEFMMAANLGEELKPLARIASGGELSRVLLALKAILAKAEQIPTIVFDEVDAGIGGVPRSSSARNCEPWVQMREVLCVTHLPVVASFGTHHYSVRAGA